MYVYINPLKGRAVKCYTLLSRANLHFNFWHSVTLALSPDHFYKCNHLMPLHFKRLIYLKYRLCNGALSMIETCIGFDGSCNSCCTRCDRQYAVYATSLTRRCRLSSRSGRSGSLMRPNSQWVGLNGTPASSCASTRGKHRKHFVRSSSPTPDIRLKAYSQVRYIASSFMYDFHVIICRMFVFVYQLVSLAHLILLWSRIHIISRLVFLPRMLQHVGLTSEKEIRRW